MYEDEQKNYVVGYDGTPLTLADLPQSNTTRWVARRKATVVLAVEGGLLSLDEACARYAISHEEFLSWRVAYGRHGVGALKAGRVSELRP